MAKIFEITSDIKKIAQDAIDDLIDQMGKNVRLIYTPKFEACSCNSATNPGSKPSTYVRHGGPVPVSNMGICPLCNGTNKRQTEQSTIIKLLCTWEVKDFTEPFKGIAVQQPNSYLQSKFYLSDLPKILQAIEMVMQIDLEGYIQHRFRLKGKPIDSSNIFQNRYGLCLWEQIG